MATDKAFKKKIKRYNKCRHQYSTIKVNTDGTMKIKCLRCGEEKQIPIPAGG